MIRVCKHCGDEFKQVGRLNKMYCSRKCNAVAQSKKRNGTLTKKICKWCETKFMPNKYNHTTQSFCSDTCKSKTKNLETLYDISPIDYRRLLGDQNNCCAICGEHNENLTRDLGVYTCRKTGDVLGLLCFNCVQGISAFGHDTNTLTNALAYLGDRHG